MSEEYDVGYRKPPKHTRFRKGQSGNPAGRPRGTKNLRTDLKEELAETIRVREAGGTKTISKQRGIVKALVAGALKGQARATGPLLGLLGRLRLDEEAEVRGDELTDEEQEVLELLQQRLGTHVMPKEPAARTAEDDSKEEP